MIKVALTGNLGSGKSTILKLFEEISKDYNYKFCPLDADKIIDDFYKKDKETKEKVTQLFGEDILENGFINKKKIASLVFNDKEKLTLLEQFLHKKLYDYVNSIKDCDILMLEASLVIEKGSYKNFDFVIMVYVPKEISIQRSIQKNMDIKDIEKRLSFQMDPEIKKNYANFVIDNTKPLDDVKKDVKKIYEKLIGELK